MGFFVHLYLTTVLLTMKVGTQQARPIHIPSQRGSKRGVFIQGSPELHGHVEKAHGWMGPLALPSAAPLCSQPRQTSNTKWTNIYLP